MRNLTLFSLLKIALKHLFVLIIAAIVAASGAYSYCKYIATPKYSATGYVLVTNGAILTGGTSTDDDSTKGSDLTASSNLISTITDILNTNGIYKQLAENLDNKYSYTSLNARSTVARKSEKSLFLKVTFTASNSKEAVQLVNAYLDIVPDYINSYIQNSATAITLCDHATKIYPQTFSTTMLAAVCGSAIIYFILLLIYSSNIVIQDEEDFKQRFDVPVIGCVPDFTQAKSNKSYYYNKYYKRSGYYGYKK